jgi:nitroreductase
MPSGDFISTFRIYTSEFPNPSTNPSTHKLQKWFFVVVPYSDGLIANIDDVFRHGLDVV